jgi:hypothetical protein
LKQTLKVPGTILPPAASRQLSLNVTGPTLSVVLARNPTTEIRTGATVTGRSVGTSVPSANASVLLSRLEIYISGVPGTLYSDGTFEFSNVPPGQRNIVRYSGISATAAAVVVGDRDLDDVVLQRVSILPLDIHSRESEQRNGSVPVSRILSMPSLSGRVVDEISREPIKEGTITLMGRVNDHGTFPILESGEVTVPNLLPGDYNLIINASGYSNEPQSVRVGIENLKQDLVARRQPQ